MWHMVAKHGSTAARGEQVLQELAEEINDPVREWRAVATWCGRVLAALNRVMGPAPAWSRKFEALADDLALPARSLAEDWDVMCMTSRSGSTGPRAFSWVQPKMPGVDAKERNPGWNPGWNPGT